MSYYLRDYKIFLVLCCKDNFKYAYKIKHLFFPYQKLEFKETFFKSSKNLLFIFFSAPYNADCEDPYPSLSDFHDYEPNLEFDDSDLLQQKHPENDDELELPEVDRQHTPNTYIESPMSGNAVIYFYYYD